MSIQERRENAVEKCLSRSKNPKLTGSWKVGGAQYASDGYVAYKFVDKAIIDGLPQLADDTPKIDLENLFNQWVSKSANDMYFDTVKNIRELAIKPCYRDKEGNKIVAIGFVSAWRDERTLFLNAKLLDEVVTAMSLSDEDTITFKIFGEKRSVLVENEKLPDSAALICPMAMNNSQELPPYVFSAFAKKDFSEETLKKLSEKRIEILEKQKADELKEEMRASLKSKNVISFKKHIKKIKSLAEGVKPDSEIEEMLDMINRALEGHKLETLKLFEAKEAVEEKKPEEAPKQEEVAKADDKAEEKAVFVFEGMDLLDAAI